MTRTTLGHKHLRRWFRNQPYLVKAHEAEAMGMSKQQLDHILSGRRRPTLTQAIAIYHHTGVAISAWEIKGRK